MIFVSFSWLRCQERQRKTLPFIPVFRLTGDHPLPPPPPPTGQFWRQESFFLSFFFFFLIVTRGNCILLFGYSLRMLTENLLLSTTLRAGHRSLLLGQFGLICNAEICLGLLTYSLLLSTTSKLQTLLAIAKWRKKKYSFITPGCW